MGRDRGDRERERLRDIHAPHMIEAVGLVVLRVVAVRARDDRRGAQHQVDFLYTSAAVYVRGLRRSRDARGAPRARRSERATRAALAGRLAARASAPTSACAGGETHRWGSPTLPVEAGRAATTRGCTALHGTARRAAGGDTRPPPPTPTSGAEPLARRCSAWCGGEKTAATSRGGILPTTESERARRAGRGKGRAGSSASARRSRTTQQRRGQGRRAHSPRTTREPARWH